MYPGWWEKGCVHMQKQDAQPLTGGKRESSLARWLRAGRSLVPTRDELTFGVALSLYLAWVDNMFYGAKIIGRSWSPFQEVGAGDVLYYVSIVTLLVLLCFLAWRGSVVDRVLYSSRMCTAGAAGMVLSTLLILTTIPGGMIEAVAIPFAGVLSALASGVCLMQWSRLTSGLDYRGIVITGALGYVFAKVIVVLAQMGGFAFRDETILVILVMTALNCLFAAGAGLLFRKCAIRQGAWGSWLSAEEGKDPERDVPPDASNETDTVIRMTAALVVIGFIPVLAREMGLGMVRESTGMPAYWFVEMHTVSLFVMALAALLIVAGFLSERARLHVGGCYRLITLLAFVGSLSMPLPFVLDDAGFALPGIWASSAFDCLHIMMWIVIASFGRMHRELSTRYYAVVRIGWTLGPLLGGLLAHSLWRSGALSMSGIQITYLLAAGCTLAVYLMFAYIFPERSLAHALDVMPRRVRRPFQERCHALAQRSGLSEREFEIMMYFAKGRDAAYIQQELVLTHSTVSTHRQHIYAKLGVHSQQELLDLLNEAE